MSIEKLKSTISGIVEDLATLEVATFTGSPGKDKLPPPTAMPADGSLPKPSSSKKLFEGIRKRLNDSTLVGYSRFEIEGDSINYVNSDLGAGKKHLLEGHSALVEGAQKSRKDFFEFVLNVV